ncbi:hypothetical protein [Leptodesmis sp.]|uniref:hypothetical protein n=1 Tax=Leptodesmis sp. TaxID=3100501 RepID=UPI0040534C8A
MHATSEEATEMLNLVSEFHTNNFHYLVVSINMLAEGKGIDSLLQQFLKTLGIDQFLEVDRFELNHHLCAIVEAKSDTAKSDLIFLKILTERELQIANCGIGRTGATK